MRKKKLSLLEELSKKRADSIISVYSSIDNYESKVQAFMTAVAKGQVKEGESEEVSGSLDQACENIKKAADSNRFLLGEELYESSVELTNLIYTRLHLLAAKDMNGLKESAEQIEALRNKVQACLPELYKS